MRGRGPFFRVAVAGGSMEPTLHDGDWLLVRRTDGRRVRADDVVVARRPDRPELVLVKRAVRRVGQGWWLLGDEPEASDDSRVFGVVPDALVLGRVLARYHPDPRLLGPAARTGRSG